MILRLCVVLLLIAVVSARTYQSGPVVRRERAIYRPEDGRRHYSRSPGIYKNDNLEFKRFGKRFQRSVDPQYKKQYNNDLPIWIQELSDPDIADDVISYLQNRKQRSLDQQHVDLSINLSPETKPKNQQHLSEQIDEQQRVTIQRRINRYKRNNAWALYHMCQEIRCPSSWGAQYAPPETFFQPPADLIQPSYSPVPSFGVNVGPVGGISGSVGVSQYHEPVGGSSSVLSPVVAPVETMKTPSTSQDAVYSAGVEWSAQDGSKGIGVGVEHKPEVSNEMTVSGQATVFQDTKHSITLNTQHTQLHDKDFRRDGPGTSSATLNLNNISNKDGASLSVSGTHTPGSPQSGSIDVKLPLAGVHDKNYDGQVFVKAGSQFVEGTKPVGKFEIGVEGSF